MQNIKIQIKILNILKYFDKVCKKEKLTYYAIGGTLLGAVRHKGFIPWDDDIDIGMPRADYDKLIEIKEKFTNGYVLESHKVNFNYKYPYIKIYDNSTKAIEDLVNPPDCGVWIDVFPIDGTFDNEIALNIHLKFIQLMKKLISYRSGLYSESNKKVITIYFLRCISLLLKILPDKYYFYILDFLLNIKNKGNFKNSGNLLGFWGRGEVVSSSVFESKLVLVFEDFNINVPVDYKKYLASVYGNYMVMPPIEKRKSHTFKHISID